MVELSQDEHDVLNALNEGVALLDDDGTILYVNKALQGLIGRDERELVGEPMRRFYDEDCRSEFDQTFQAAQTQGEATRTFRYEQPNGRQFEQRLTIRALKEVGYICIKDDVTETEYTKEGLRHEAYYDDLTGLRNINFLKRYLARYDDRIAVLIVDLKDFAGINSLYGAEVADQAIRRVAQRISTVAGERVVARRHGDSFGLAVEATDCIEEAKGLFEQITGQFGTPISIDRHDIEVGIEGGIAAHPDHAERPEQCIARADIARDQSSDDCTVYSLEEKQQEQQEHRTRQQVREGLKNDDFMLYYQPQIELANNRVAGFEGLLRWTWQGDVYDPGSFIDVARQDAELIQDMTEMTLRAGARQLTRWCERGHDHHVGINVPTSMFNNRLVDLVGELKQTHDIDDDCLVIEITERTAAGDSEYVAGVMNDLKAIGVPTVIDDFGTGYSSLEYIADFPLDTIKIDKRYVLGLNDGGTKDLLESVLMMTNNMELTVIAEGVESKEHADFLRDLGCQYAQGFYFGRPEPPDEVDESGP